MTIRRDFSTVLAAVLLISMPNADAFSSMKTSRATSSVLLKAAAKDQGMGDMTTNLLATRRHVMTSGVAVALSWLATRDSAFAADSAATSLDFSLPKYDTKMQGFGEGSEAYSSKLNGESSSALPSATFTDPGANEKDKQLRSMQLAEEARQAALAKKKAEAKMREEEERRRAAEKKAKNAERFASIFS